MAAVVDVLWLSERFGEIQIIEDILFGIDAGKVKDVCLRLMRAAA